MWLDVGLAGLTLDRWPARPEVPAMRGTCCTDPTRCDGVRPTGCHHGVTTAGLARVSDAPVQYLGAVC